MPDQQILTSQLKNKMKEENYRLDIDTRRDKSGFLIVEINPSNQFLCDLLRVEIGSHVDRCDLYIQVTKNAINSPKSFNALGSNVFVSIFADGKIVVTNDLTKEKVCEIQDVPWFLTVLEKYKAAILSLDRNSSG